MPRVRDRLELRIRVELGSFTSWVSFPPLVEKIPLWIQGLRMWRRFLLWIQDLYL